MAFRFKLMVPPVVGVPESVLVVGLKVNQDGRVSPVLVVAESVILESESLKRSDLRV